LRGRWKNAPTNEQSAKNGGQISNHNTLLSFDIFQTKGQAAATPAQIGAAMIGDRRSW
jgi:hypothetical protein